MPARSPESAPEAAQPDRTSATRGIRIHGSSRGVRGRPHQGMSFEARLRLLALLMAVPGLLVSGGLLLAQHASRGLWATLLGVILLASLIIYGLLIEHIVR